MADEGSPAWVRERTPAGRWGRVEDLVGTLIYLCSDASRFVNGQVVYVDGGMLAVLWPRRASRPDRRLSRTSCNKGAARRTFKGVVPRRAGQQTYGREPA